MRRCPSSELARVGLSNKEPSTRNDLTHLIWADGGTRLSAPRWRCHYYLPLAIRAVRKGVFPAWRSARFGPALLLVLTSSVHFLASRTDGMAWLASFWGGGHDAVRRRITPPAENPRSRQIAALRGGSSRIALLAGECAPKRLSTPCVLLGRLVCVPWPFAQSAPARATWGVFAEPQAFGGWGAM